jgi:hypothetical protein
MGLSDASQNVAGQSSFCLLLDGSELIEIIRNFSTIRRGLWKLAADQ